MMKSVSYLSFLLMILLSYISCDNELNLVEPGADIPVVYSLLSSNENEQFVRVERGFIDEDIPGTILAQDPTEVYYDEVGVSLVNLTKNKTFTLSKVNANEIGYEREDGFFLTDPNFVYRLVSASEDFSPGDAVRLEVDRGDEYDLVTSEITLLDTLLVTTPASGATINFPTTNKYKVQWVNGKNSPARNYIINMYIHYEEANLDDVEPEFEPKVLEWKFAEVKDESIAEVPGIDFFKHLSNNLEVGNYFRTFEHFDLEFIYSGEEMSKYQDFLNANTGITSSQPIPPYTNLSEGLGLVAERNVQYIREVFVGTATKDSLRDGRFTKNLGFQ